MPKYVTHCAFFFLAITALSGVWMRLYAISTPSQIVAYDHILHAHSHAAILGWTFLAVFIIFLKLAWEHLQQKKQATILIIVTFLITFSMTIAFIWQGYALYSIILSTTHILIEYWALIFVYRSLKKVPDIPAVSKTFIKGALLTLFISSIGPWSLGAIGSQGLQHLPIFDMAVYFYLHFQYNGWLYLILIGLFLYLLVKKGISLPTKILKVSFWIYIFALFPGYFLSVLWYDFRVIGIVFGAFGAIGQLVGVLTLCFAIFQIRFDIAENFSKRVRLLLGLSFLLLLSKTVMELALLHLPFANLIYETRSVVVGYLHLTLLGFISLLILSLFQMGQLLDEKNPFVRMGLATFIIGFTLNEIILFISGLFKWLDLTYLPFENELLLFAAILLFVGTLSIWSNVFKQENLLAIETKAFKKTT
ncbi:hypothetical protein [Pseudogracilibacillus sp. SO30301A]|uniref:hypothetical protein n=1 Tax=Pseudogracilibacillus sp. SO30301A TaxID=3098291 RepID=UPI00300DE8FE